jgi:hypothetical protein
MIELSRYANRTENLRFAGDAISKGYDLATKNDRLVKTPDSVVNNCDDLATVAKRLFGQKP